MIEVIKPYSNEEFNEDLLLDQNKIIKNDSKNFYWHASIFPKSKIDDQVDFLYKKNRIITIIDDSIFLDMGFKLLDNVNQIIIENNKRNYIKSIKYGDFNDSIKRYTNLNKPTDINKNSQQFLNIPKPKKNINRLDVEQEDLIFKNQEDLTEFLPKVKPDLFEDNINHPHINKVKLEKKAFKFNSKDYIIETLKWAKEKGIKYIYCINENRPYIQNKNFVTPYVYYTIIGF